MAPIQGYFDQPFGNAGDLTVVPDGVQPDGSVSYTQGFGPDYELDPNTDPSALDVPRAQTNQIFNDITTVLQQYQQFSVPPFITATMNGGTPFTYSIGTRVRYNPGSGLRVYQSSKNNNTDLPTVTASWSDVSAIGGTLFSGGTSGGSANVQTVTTIEGSFLNTAANMVTWKAGFSNTGSATLAPDGVSAVPLKKLSPSGLINLISGDIVVGQQYLGISDGTNIQVLNPVFPGYGVRTVLSANTNFYVTTTGNDSNAGTIGSPWLTVQHAINYIVTNIDLAGFTATINVAAGTYTGSAAVGAPFTGGGSVSIVGSGSCIFSTAGNTIDVSGGAVLTPVGITIQSSGGVGVHCSNGGVVNLGTGTIFGACGLAHMLCEFGGQVNTQGNSYTISGSSPYHALVRNNGNFDCNAAPSATVTITGTPTFSSSFWDARACSSIVSQNYTWSGAVTAGTVPYSVTYNGVINGVTGLPGSGSPVQSTGGQFS